MLMEWGHFEECGKIIYMSDNQTTLRRPLAIARLCTDITVSVPDQILIIERECHNDV